MIGIILDIILVAIILLNIYVSYKKGLVRLAVGLIAVIVAIILSIILYKPVSNLIIANTQIDEKIENTIIETFTNKEEEGEEVRYVGLINYIEKYVNDAINKTQTELVTESAKTISVKVINIIVIIGIFIITRISLLLLTFISDMITSLPIIKQCNEVGGIVYGIIKALLIIYVVLAIVFFVINITGNVTVSDAITSSYITKIFYNNNLLLNILF